MINLYNGLAGDAALIGAASGLRLEIDLATVPLGDGVETVARELGLDPAEFASRGGKNYELASASPPPTGSPRTGSSPA